MSTIQRVAEAVEKFLQENGAISRSKSIPGPKLVDYLLGTGSFNLARGSLFSYVSTGANDPNISKIVSGGPRSGYWIDDSIVEKEKEKEEIESQPVVVVAGGKKKNFSEKNLYPLIELWLATKGYRSKDVSDLRSGGKWGNPDIVGLAFIDSFGTNEIEIVSCEVKTSTSNWEQFIFEAVSHKRFSNRAYYCARVKDDAPLPDAMRFYAEKFRVGLVEVNLTDEEAFSLIGIDRDYKKLENYLSNIYEVFPALFDAVSSLEKVKILERLEVENHKQYYEFGLSY